MNEVETVIVTVKADLGPSSWSQLSEQFRVRVGSLDDVLGLLQRFHKLAEEIRDEQAGLTAGAR